VDEIVVVDTGSTDDTAQVAAEAGAKVVHSPWQADFSQARNVSLSAATGRWILVLDADERLTSVACDQVRTLLHEEAARNATPGRAFSLLQRSSVAGRSAAGQMLVAIVRLFPNHPGIRYSWPIHEQVVDALDALRMQVVSTRIEIEHLGYADPQKNRAKQERNLALLETQVASGHEHPVSLFLLAGAYLDLGYTEKALQAYRRCGQVAAANPEIRRGAVVRELTALLRLKRLDEAVALVEQAGSDVAHPEMAVQAGEALLAKGRLHEARLQLEAVLVYPDDAYIPPCDVGMMKIRSIVALADCWKQNGKPQLGLALLRMGQALHQSGHTPDLPRVQGLYRAAGVA
jgi:hypothetical protein